jgi:hypothetical protein
MNKHGRVGKSRRKSKRTSDKLPYPAIPSAHRGQGGVEWSIAESDSDQIVPIEEGGRVGELPPTYGLQEKHRLLVSLCVAIPFGLGLLAVTISQIIRGSLDINNYMAVTGGPLGIILGFYLMGGEKRRR